MLLSSRGMIAARAMETRSLHPWCVQVSGEAALIPALGTLADLLLHLSLQLHLGIVQQINVSGCFLSTSMKVRSNEQL